MNKERITITANDVALKLEQLLTGTISREEAVMWATTVQKSSYPGFYRIHHLSHNDTEAFYALSAARLCEQDFSSIGEPYFYRMEDFAEHLAILRCEEATHTTLAGLRQVRYHQLRPTLSRPIALFTVGADELSARNQLPHIRGNDQLDYTKTILVLTPENKQFALVEHLRAPMRPFVDLYIEASAENDTSEIEHVMNRLQIEPRELYWRTEHFQELKQEYHDAVTRKVSQQSGQQ